MKRATIFVAAGLFLLATTIKLAFPEKSKDTIGAIRTVVTGENRIAAAEASSDSAEAVTVTINAADFLAGVEGDAVLSEAAAAAVETFLAEQSAYSAMEIPSNVSYGVPEIGFRFVRPVQAKVSSAFGYREHPIEEVTSFHYGMDLAADCGDDILSFADGTVSSVGQDEVHGNYVCIDHADGYSSTYAHCSTVYVSEGQSVLAGEKIALVGSTGEVTGPHLHFELTKDGVFLNPAFFFASL